MGVASNPNIKLHRHTDLVAGEIEDIVGETHPDIVASHVYGQMKFFIPDNEL